MHETHSRSVVKAITWRVVAMSLTLAIAYAATDNIDKAGGITITAGILSTVFYYLHERLWNVISWGRHEL